MQYVLMIHAAESRYASMGADQVEAVMRAYGHYSRELFGTGRAGDSAALEGTPAATTVRVRDGQRVVQDGPFAETREQLGGYYTFDASTEGEALEWAAKVPDASGGVIEVRPLVPSPSAAGPAGAAPAGAKEYLLLIYEREALWASMGEAEKGATYARYGQFSQAIKASGHFVAGAQLDASAKAKCVRVEGDRRVVRDGPFAETREQLGGYYRVRANDLDEAIAMAARIPAAETGTIEIRPVADTSAYV
jgi:hypothetical protein